MLINISYNTTNFQGKTNALYKFAQIERAVITDKMSIKKREILMRNNKVLDLLEEGVSIAEIAKTLNVCEATIREFIRKNEIIKKGVDNLKKIILSRLINGESKENIAKSLNIKEYFVKRLSEKFNVYKILKADREKKILELVHKGAFIKDIAKEVNLSECRVREILREYTLSTNTELSINTFTKARIEEIKELILKGVKRKDIAKKFSMSIQRINEIAEKNGLYRKAKDIRDKKIKELASNGLNNANIAQIVNVSEATVSRVLKTFSN